MSCFSAVTGNLYVSLGEDVNGQNFDWSTLDIHVYMTNYYNHDYDPGYYDYSDYGLWFVNGASCTFWMAKSNVHSLPCSVDPTFESSSYPAELQMRNLKPDSVYTLTIENFYSSDWGIYDMVGGNFTICTSSG